MKVLVIGAGKLGTKVTTAMLNGEIDVTVMDNNKIVLDRLKEQLDVLTINANGAVKSVLEELNVKSYSLVIAVTSSDESNILITSMAKELGCQRTIARIRKPEYANQIEFLKTLYKIDHVINPELATSNEILRYLMKSYTFYFGDYVQGKVSLGNYNIKNSLYFVNKKIHELEKFDKLLIVAILRNGDIIIPHGNTILLENDSIYVIGERRNIKVVTDLLKESIINSKTIKKVMILGGSKISYYLADKLSKKGVTVKIIESDLNRCRELSEILSNKVLIIHGNGTDVNLLEEENLSEMDAFIGVTGFDEQNLFTALRAKQLDVPKVIAKISRESYVHIIEKLGIDMAINPVNITASDVVKYIRGGRVVSVSLLLGGHAEVTEIIASKGLKILNVPIRKLNLPKGIIIGAIVHKNKIIIPDGNSVIQHDDRIVVFSLLTEVPALEMFFQLRKDSK
jgi:trk system potassium uptake protein TrkA